MKYRMRLLLKRLAAGYSLKRPTELQPTSTEQATHQPQGSVPVAHSTAFTPGPWRKGSRDGCVVCGEPQTDGGSGYVPYYGGYLIAGSIEEQNVSLIAAAPELYEACCLLLKEIDAILNDIGFV